VITKSNQRENSLKSRT